MASESSRKRTREPFPLASPFAYYLCVTSRDSPKLISSVRPYDFSCFEAKCMHYWLTVRWRWLDIGHKFFSVFLWTEAKWWSIIVSLRNRTAGRKGRQNAHVWQTWQGNSLHVLSWSSLNINVFWSFTKRSVWIKVKFGGRYFSNKITVTFLTQGLPSSFLSRPIAKV